MLETPKVVQTKHMPTVLERDMSLQTQNTTRREKMLEAQIQAATAYSDFLEECLVEMATLLYSE